MRRRIQNVRRKSPRARAATKRLLKTHAADICAIAAGVGVVSTGVSAYYGGKASVLQNDEKPWSKEWLKNQCRILAPTCTIAGITLASICGSRHFGRLREKQLSEACALLAAAYQNRESRRRDCKTDATSRRGEQDTSGGYNQDHPIEDTGTGDVIFIEDFTGRRFKASWEAYEYAKRKLQENFSVCGFATLNDFYGLLGLSETSAGEVLGWTLDQMIMDPYYDGAETPEDLCYDMALTSLCIEEDDGPDGSKIIYYCILPIGSLAGIGPCNY